MRRSPVFSILLLSGCMVSQSISDKGALILKPQINAGSYLSQTTISAYTQASINHLRLKLYTFDDSEHDQGIQKTLLNAQLDNPIVFANLKPNITYRIKAYAYASSDDSLLISTSDADSYTDVTLTDDDRPTVGTLKVKLIDRAFSGQATSSLVINNGGYSAIGPESLAIAKVVSTFAGGGGGYSGGYLDGFGTAALFNRPYSLVFDGSGNIYLTELSNNVIRKITRTGVVTTFAGGGGSNLSGYTDGTGTAAKFNGPIGLIFDGSGNMYVTEVYNNLIRKVTSAGVVTTFAGGGGSTLGGYADGTGTAAKFNGIEGIVIDGSGNLFVADYSNNLIRKITPAGVVSTLAGGGGATSAGYTDGIGTSALFSGCTRMAIDGSGNLYVSDYFNHLIRKITNTGVVTTFAGGRGSNLSGFTDGTGTAATFFKPSGICLDGAGNLIISDTYNHAIRKVTSTGVVSTLAGSGVAGYLDGTGTAAKFNTPVGVGLDSFGNLYVSEYANNLIRILR